MSDKIVVLYPVKDAHKNQLQKSFPNGNFLYSSSRTISQEELMEANIILGNPKPAMLRLCSNVKLVQLNSAGNDAYQASDIPSGCVLCNASGAYGLGISEYLLATTLSLSYNLPTYQRQQVVHEWSDAGVATPIYGSTVLVVGFGDIGSCYAKRMKALGAYVIALKRVQGDKPDYVDELVLSEQLQDVVPKADIIANSLPHTKQTEHMFNKDMFALMKKSAIFLNVGRGATVDSEALYHALSTNALRGAAIDVTETEPLPHDHPLWELKNLIITPHISGKYHVPQTMDMITDMVCENLQHFQQNQMYINVVDFETGYRKR